MRIQNQEIFEDMSLGRRNLGQEDEGRGDVGKHVVKHNAELLRLAQQSVANEDKFRYMSKQVEADYDELQRLLKTDPDLKGGDLFSLPANPSRKARHRLARLYRDSRGNFDIPGVTDSELEHRVKVLCQTEMLQRDALH